MSSKFVATEPDILASLCRDSNSKEQSGDNVLNNQVKDTSVNSETTIANVQVVRKSDSTLKKETPVSSNIPKSNNVEVVKQPHYNNKHYPPKEGRKPYHNWKQPAQQANQNNGLLPIPHLLDMTIFPGYPFQLPYHSIMRQGGGQTGRGRFSTNRGHGNNTKRNNNNNDALHKIAKPNQNMIANKHPNQVSHSLPKQEQMSKNSGVEDNHLGRPTPSTGAIPKEAPTSFSLKKSPSIASLASIGSVKSSVGTSRSKLNLMIIGHMFTDNLQAIKSYIETSYTEDTVGEVVEEAFEIMLDKNEHSRKKTGKLISDLMRFGLVSNDQVVEVVTTLYANAIQKAKETHAIWSWIAELIVPLIDSDCFSIKDLQVSTKTIAKTQYAKSMLWAVFQLLIKNQGPEHFHTLWTSSGVALTDFFHPNQVDQFVKQNKLEFLLEKKTNVSDTQANEKIIHGHLESFIERKEHFEHVSQFLLESLESLKIMYTNCITNDFINNIFTMLNNISVEFVSHTFSDMIGFDLIQPEIAARFISTILENSDIKNNKDILKNTAQILADLITTNRFTFLLVCVATSPIVKTSVAYEFFMNFFNFLLLKNDINGIEQKFKTCGLTLYDFVDPFHVKDFAKRFGFHVGKPPTTQTEQLHMALNVEVELVEMIKNGENLDAIKDWISVHVGNRTKDQDFKKNLISAVCEGSLKENLRTDIFNQYKNLISSYINMDELELSTLLTILKLITKDYNFSEKQKRYIPQKEQKIEHSQPKNIIVQSSNQTTQNVPQKRNIQNQGNSSSNNWNRKYNTQPHRKYYRPWNVPKQKLEMTSSTINKQIKPTTSKQSPEKALSHKNNQIEQPPCSKESNEQKLSENKQLSITSSNKISKTDTTDDLQISSEKENNTLILRMKEPPKSAHADKTDDVTNNPQQSPSHKYSKELNDLMEKLSKKQVQQPSKSDKESQDIPSKDIPNTSKTLENVKHETNKYSEEVPVKDDEKSVLSPGPITQEVCSSKSFKTSDDLSKSHKEDTPTLILRLKENPKDVHHEEIDNAANKSQESNEYDKQLRDIWAMLSNQAQIRELKENDKTTLDVSSKQLSKELKTIESSSSMKLSSSEEDEISEYSKEIPATDDQFLQISSSKQIDESKYPGQSFNPLLTEAVEASGYSGEDEQAPVLSCEQTSENVYPGQSVENLNPLPSETDEVNNCLVENKQEQAILSKTTNEDLIKSDQALNPLVLQGDEENECPKELDKVDMSLETNTVKEKETENKPLSEPSTELSLPKQYIEEIIQENIGSNSSSEEQEQASKENIIKCMKNGNHFRHIKQLIDTNFGEMAKEHNFMKILISCIIESSLGNDGVTLKADTFQYYAKLLVLYTKGNNEQEMNVLCSVQEYMGEKEQLKGLIHQIFDVLWKEKFINEETFLNFMDSKIQGDVLKLLIEFYEKLM